MHDTLKRAFALLNKGAHRESEGLCKAFLEEHPMEPSAWHMRGYAAVQLNELDNAIRYISRAIELKPNVYSMHFNLGAALAAQGQFKKAIALQRKAIGLNSTGSDAYFSLGNCLTAINETEEARDAYLEALRLKPDWAEVLESLSANARQMGEPGDALDYALRALEQNPKLPRSNTIIGDIYLHRREYDLARKYYLATLENNPKDATANSNFGLLSMRTGHYEESVASYRKALATRGDSPGAQQGLSHSLLALGRLSEGWKHFEARLNMEHLLAARPMPARRLDQRPTNMRALAWTDEGVGEQIMFSSLIPEIVEDCSSLTLECDPRLAPLFQRSFPNVDFFPRQDPPHPKFSESYDGQFCLSGAAKWYRPNFESFPKLQTHLKADENLIREFQRSYQSNASVKPLIGISWRTLYNLKFAPQKTIPLDNWGPLLSIPGATFVNLQYGDCREEITEAEKKFGVQIVSDPRVDSLKDLDSFASQVAAMDLVVTISNTTAHMAGALNVPVWTLVPKGFGALWHWFLDRDDSPWYPSARLLRQTQQGDWNPVVDQASLMLADFVNQWRPKHAK